MISQCLRKRGSLPDKSDSVLVLRVALLQLTSADEYFKTRRARRRGFEVSVFLYALGYYFLAQ